MRKYAIILAACASVTANSSHGQTFYAIPRVSGSADAAFGVSADGQVAVGTRSDQPFRWTASGGAVQLPILTGATRGYARSVSVDGSFVLGGCSQNPTRALVWDASGNMTDLGTLGGSTTHGGAISRSGAVVVGVSNDASGEFKAFTWTSPAGMIGTGAYGAGLVYGVDDLGSTIVGRRNVSGTRPWLWRVGASEHDLGDLPGGTAFGVAYAVSGDGQIVVGFSTEATRQWAFRWTSAEGMVPLVDTAGVFIDGTNAHSVNCDGTVIVGYGRGNFRFGESGMIWTQAGGMQEADAYLDAAGVQRGDSHVSKVWGVSDDGRTFVGQTWDNFGVRAFVAKLPPPPACGTADFNGDGDLGTDADIEAFFACLGGSCCQTCFQGQSDFNGDGDLGTDADIESFFRVLGGGPC